MKQLARSVNLKDNPQGIEAYVRYHKDVWPEVKEALKEVGVHQMKIWLSGRRLFMLIEVDDDFEPEVNFERYYGLHPKVKEWEAIMIMYQEPLPEAKEGQVWVDMEQVFQLV